MQDLGIVGAGVGGLTLALACRRAGLERIRIYEQREAPSYGSGHGIQLTPNATRVLHALGLKDALHTVACQSDAHNYRSHRTGYQIAMRPLGPFAESRYGAPFHQLLREDLIGLLAAALQERGIGVLNGWRCTGVSTADAQVSLACADRDPQRHDLLVGCDGVNSLVKTFMHEEAPPAFTGHVAWRGITPTDALPGEFNSRPVTTWLGPGRHLTQFPVRGGELVAFTAIVESSYAGPDSWYEPAEKAALIAAFDGWHPVIQALIEAAGDVHSWPLYDRAPLARWTDGRVTLLGDACHPALPYLAQGAALAIEDAWVLARMLENWEEEIETALSEYERYRRPRAARVQVRSRAEGETLHLRDRRQILWRNLRMALSSRYLPEIAMQRYDWLYGYDCVKGFH